MPRCTVLVPIPGQHRQADPNRLFSDEQLKLTGQTAFVRLQHRADVIPFGQLQKRPAAVGAKERPSKAQDKATPTVIVREEFLHDLAPLMAFVAISVQIHKKFTEVPIGKRPQERLVPQFPFIGEFLFVHIAENPHRSTDGTVVSPHHMGPRAEPFIATAHRQPEFGIKEVFPRRRPRQRLLKKCISRRAILRMLQALKQRFARRHSMLVPQRQEFSQLVAPLNSPHPTVSCVIHAPIGIVKKFVDERQTLRMRVAPDGNHPLLPSGFVRDVFLHHVHKLRHTVGREHIKAPRTLPTAKIFPRERKERGTHHNFGERRPGTPHKIIGGIGQVRKKDLTQRDDRKRLVVIPGSHSHRVVFPQHDVYRPRPSIVRTVAEKRLRGTEHPHGTVGTKAIPNHSRFSRKKRRHPGKPSDRTDTASVLLKKMQLAAMVRGPLALRHSL